MKKLLFAFTIVMLAVLTWRNFRETPVPADFAGAANADAASANSREPAFARDEARTAPVADVSETPPDADDLVATIRTTKKCFDTRDCSFPSRDPHEYDFAVGEELRSLLRRLNEEYGAADESRPLVEPLARELLASLNDSVQDAALDLLGRFPPSPENLRAMMTGLKDSPDALLANKALGEFKRYLGTPLEEEMQGFLREWVATGPHFASREVAAGILPFINDHSYEQYQKTLTRLPSNTAHAQALAAALDEYRRLKSGG